MEDKMQGWYSGQKTCGQVKHKSGSRELSLTIYVIAIFYHQGALCDIDVPDPHTIGLVKSTKEGKEMKNNNVQLLNRCKVFAGTLPLTPVSLYTPDVVLGSSDHPAMDQKSTDQFSMDQPPTYSTPQVNERRKTWLWSIGVLVLLAVFAVGATWIGVYMTQKHMEAVVEMAFQSKSGESGHQTVMVSNMENVAAFYIRTNSTSWTILYDFRRDIIGFRRMSSEKCFVMKMGSSNVLTMSDILKSIQMFQSQNPSSDSEISYSLLEGGRADRTTLGVPINILCRDVPIHWATQDNSPEQRWRLTFKFRLFRKTWTVTIGN